MGSAKKIGLIGRLDLDCTLFDGQTVKTRMMYRLLCELYGKQNIVIVETKDYKRNALSIAMQTARCLYCCEDVFVLLSRNGRRAFFPLLSFAARYFHTNVYHNLIGGWLAKDIDEFPQWVGYLNSFSVNWVESRQLVERLCELGVNNAEYLPNFKYLDAVQLPKEAHYGPVYRFCTFSRVQELKGINDAVEAVETLVARGYDCFLDLYGPIDASYRADFEKIIKVCNRANYKGCVAPEQSVKVISQYDALLFPTKWKLEGIPGTIIDALSAGVPVISSKWQYYNEMLEDGVTGFGYEIGRSDQLVDAIEKFISLGDSANSLRKNCLDRAKAYTPEAVSGIVLQAVEDNV